MESSLVCLECGSRYSTQKKLTRHKKIHSKQLFKCEDCGKEVEGPTNMNNHKRNHTILTCKHCKDHNLKTVRKIGTPIHQYRSAKILTIHNSRKLGGNVGGVVRGRFGK